MPYSMYRQHWVIDNHSFFCVCQLRNSTSKVSETLPSYIVHSSFAVVFPLHLIFLKYTSATPIRAYLEGLSAAFKVHFAKVAGKRAAADDVEDDDSNASFPTSKLFYLIAWLTVGVSSPALLWFAAITLAS